MCGIVGYIGARQAQPILYNCLAKLEYRGYDSCGIAISNENLSIYKDTLNINELAKIVPILQGTTGIGHSRWATCGEPSICNAHPHYDCTGKFAVVHNGIIHNYEILKKQLIAEGHHFISSVDTEVIPHLIEKYYKGNLEEALEEALHNIVGSYAIATITSGENKLVAARKDSPLIIGVGESERFVASDVMAMLDYTNRIVHLEENEIGIITDSNVKIKHKGSYIQRKEHKIEWNSNATGKMGFEHYMLKEIYEQPRIIGDTLKTDYRNIKQIVSSQVVKDKEIAPLLILACGSSYHAGLVGKYIFEMTLGISVRVEFASEFNYYGHIPTKTRAIVITQSGETADTLKAVRKLRQAGCYVLAITNVIGSSVTHIASETIYTHAGCEISVAATKSFIAELAVLYRIAMLCADKRLEIADILAGAKQIADKGRGILDETDGIKELGEYLAGYNTVFYIGRGINYPIALEGALKLKEISYIHAEGYAAGEMKHGPFALLSPVTPVVAIVARDNTYEAMINNIREVKTRKVPVIALMEEDDDVVRGIADFVINIPCVNPIFSPMVNVVALQLLAYYAARKRGCAIDFPRNLAKSVTVE
ncbi:MAG: glutamine--fructose-6-phosphate transaminase (isomerizing) [Dehalococcoidales bacterium]|nr:glutamine--fructose-6-phosphate transaminase (isomerizing) [Dehalococcoidales bacterium]